jgi:hypothetical protein
MATKGGKIRTFRVISPSDVRPDEQAAAAAIPTVDRTRKDPS